MDNGRNKIMQGKICPYCGADTEYVDSSCVYGSSYGMIYICKPCDAYVGVHKGTDESLGRLANAELRKWKKATHSIFDVLWKERRMTRNQAYEWLADKLKIKREDCHIGMFDEDMCKRAIEFTKFKLSGQLKLWE